MNPRPQTLVFLIAILCFASGSFLSPAADEITIAKTRDMTFQDEKEVAEWMIAVKKGDIAAVKNLLAKPKPTDINLTGKDGWTALMWAAELGRYEMAAFLIKKGANTRIGNKEGTLALSMAAQHGHEELVKLLVDVGININSQNQAGTTALMNAALQGHMSVVKLLIKRGADLNLRDKHRNTALLLASHEGHVEVAKLLIDHGARMESGEQEWIAAQPQPENRTIEGLWQMIHQAEGDKLVEEHK